MRGTNLHFASFANFIGMQHHRVVRADVVKRLGGERQVKEDLLAVEEPLEIRLIYGKEDQRKEIAIAVTMRTPGHDFELAMGFLFTEGIIRSYDDVFGIKHCNQVKSTHEIGNVVKVALHPTAEFDEKKINRNFYTTSSCGVCGKGSIESLQMHCDSVSSDFTIDVASLVEAPKVMRKQQDVFEHTGGLHAAALFDKSGHMELLREDIGRHNALDKIIGAALSSGKVPLSQNFIMVSGRLGFELIQKCIIAGIPMIGAVGAPSSLAVALAKEYGITVAGFVKKGNYNIYTGEEKVL